MHKHLIPWIFSYLAMTSLVLAQTATDVIRGTVQDQSGAILIDAPSMRPDGNPEVGDSSNHAVFRWVTSSGHITDNLSFVRGAHRL